MDESEYTSSRRTVAPPMYSKSYPGQWWFYYVLGRGVLLGVTGTCGCGRTNHGSRGVSEHHFGRVSCGRVFWDITSVTELEMESSIMTTLHVKRLELCWSGPYDKFQLMSWPVNSQDPNPMNHIWDVMERKLSAQELLCRNIPELSVRW